MYPGRAPTSPGSPQGSSSAAAAAAGGWRAPPNTAGTPPHGPLSPTPAAGQRPQGQGGLRQQGGSGSGSRVGSPTNGGRSVMLPDLELKDVLSEENAGRLGADVVIQAEHGPQIVRLLSGTAAVSSLALALYSCVVSGKSYLLLGCYQVFFAVMCIPFEMVLDASSLKLLLNWHELLSDKAGFLKDMFTRGLFYMLQGTLWLCLCWTLHVRGAFCIVGSFLVIVGLLCGILHLFGCSSFMLRAAEEEQFSDFGPPVSGRTYNTQQMAEQRSEALSDRRGGPGLSPREFVR